jgi:hypothetical protein
MKYATYTIPALAQHFPAPPLGSLILKADLALWTIVADGDTAKLRPGIAFTQRRCRDLVAHQPGFLPDLDVAV